MLVPDVLSGVAKLAVPHEVEKVRVIGPLGALVPENVVEILPVVGKQHAASPQATALKVLTAVYLAKL